MNVTILFFIFKFLHKKYHFVFVMSPYACCRSQTSCSQYDLMTCPSKLLWGFNRMLLQYWPTAYGAGPALQQHWINSSCCPKCLSMFSFLNKYLAAGMDNRSLIYKCGSQIKPYRLKWYFPLIWNNIRFKCIKYINKTYINMTKEIYQWGEQHCTTVDQPTLPPQAI